MSNLKNKLFFAIVILFLAGLTEINGGELITCTSRNSKCFLKPLYCPAECPSKSPSNPKAKVCYVNCNSPVCKPECRTGVLKESDPLVMDYGTLDCTAGSSGGHGIICRK